MTIEAADPAALCQEVLAEGRRRADEVREEARKHGEAIVARARLEAETFRRAALDAAHREAARRAEHVLAGVAIEIGRMRAARVEALLEDIHERARRALLSGHGILPRAALVSLAAQALQRMEGDSFFLCVSVGGAAGLGDGLAGEILRRAGRGGTRLSVSEDPSITCPGFVLGDAGGHQTWDGRLTARLDRLWPALRVSVAIGAGLLGTGGLAP